MNIKTKNVRYKEELKILRECKTTTSMFGIEEYSKAINRLISRIKESTLLYCVNDSQYTSPNNKEIILAVILFNCEYAYHYSINEDINNFLHDINISDLNEFSNDDTDEIFKTVVSLIHKDVLDID